MSIWKWFRNYQYNYSVIHRKKYGRVAHWLNRKWSNVFWGDISRDYSYFSELHEYNLLRRYLNLYNESMSREFYT